MDENFKMGFKNFLITRKLKELLAMRDNEKDPDKIESIQQVINLRVNYLDDNNRKLTGKKLKEHKEKIREKYSGTKYYKYINIIHENKSKKYTVALLLVLFIGAGLGGGLNYKNINGTQYRGMGAACFFDGQKWNDSNTIGEYETDGFVRVQYIE